MFIVSGISKTMVKKLKINVPSDYISYILKSVIFSSISTLLKIAEVNLNFITAIGTNSRRFILHFLNIYNLLVFLFAS